ncbi:hypothetical protein TELCIR_18315 [Teladorsagia circumcincta]|uniref:CHCH domain protein n=1 Tax=Teladorsagia circumcincta TaxID=45464 RepID=A0A2G9TQD0_TELCI|nr:hypothetical protein TELCIR_18315 [Teladorsagia circumcincta]
MPILAVIVNNRTAHAHAGTPHLSLGFEVRLYNVKTREDLGFGRKRIVQGEPIGSRLECDNSPDSVFLEQTGTSHHIGDDLEERKRVFEETVERVQEKFFAYHRENVCADNEKEIMSCLQENPNRVLKCAPLTTLYEKCVSDFRQEVLKGN